MGFSFAFRKGSLCSVKLGAKSAEYIPVRHHLNNRHQPIVVDCRMAFHATYYSYSLRTSEKIDRTGCSFGNMVTTGLLLGFASVVACQSRLSQSIGYTAPSSSTNNFQRMCLVNMCRSQHTHTQHLSVSLRSPTHTPTQ